LRPSAAATRLLCNAPGASLEADVTTLIPRLLVFSSSPLVFPAKIPAKIPVALSYFTATSTRETIPTLIAYHSAQRQHTQARVLILYL
jgi:hypothetical protein